MDRDARTGILAATVFLAVLAALPGLEAKTSAICSTPMYDGVCCDTTSSPTMWPSGTGCCYGGQPYPGPTCPLLQVTPTPTPTLTNSSQFISQNAPPSSMTPGQTVGVFVTFKNNGTATWVDNNGQTGGFYRMALARQNVTVGPADPKYTIWGPNPIFLAPGETVLPGASKTFNFPITAPATPGIYHFQWQMAIQTIGGFGDFSPDLAINVSNGIIISPSPSPTTSPSPTPTATVQPTPSLNPIPSPTPAPTALPQSATSYIHLTCPSNLVVASNVTLSTLTLSQGLPACAPAIIMNVTSPKKQSLDLAGSGCINGQTAFTLNTTADGAYLANASYNGSSDTCVFVIAGTPPAPTPELSPALILGVGLLAALLVRKNNGLKK